MTTTTPKRRARQQRALGYLITLAALVLAVVLVRASFERHDAALLAVGCLTFLLVGIQIGNRR
jgi:hypothetical protein